MHNSHMTWSVRIVSLLAMTVLFGCQEDETRWPEPEMDARSYPKETPSMFDAESCDDTLSFVGNGTLSECPPFTQRVTCEGLGLVGGDIPCSYGCGFDFLACTGQACGNGLLEEGEACEFSELSGCTAADPEVGCALCDSSCSVVDEAVCGNGVAEYPGEQCDGDDFFLLVPDLRVLPLAQYVTGAVQCTDDCRVDLTQAGPATCWNGILELGETCEMDDSGSSLRYDDEGNRYLCDGCRLRLVPGRCGDGLRQSEAEECDGDHFGVDSNSCRENGLGPADLPASVTFTCNGNCLPNYSNCYLPYDDDVTDEDVEDIGPDSFETPDTDLSNDAALRDDVDDDAMHDTDTSSGTVDAGVETSEVDAGGADSGSSNTDAEEEAGCSAARPHASGTPTLCSIATLLALSFARRRRTIL